MSHDDDDTPVTRPGQSKKGKRLPLVVERPARRAMTADDRDMAGRRAFEGRDTNPAPFNPHEESDAVPLHEDDVTTGPMSIELQDQMTLVEREMEAKILRLQKRMANRVAELAAMKGPNPDRLAAIERDINGVAGLVRDLAASAVVDHGRDGNNGRIGQLRRDVDVLDLAVTALLRDPDRHSRLERRMDAVEGKQTKLGEDHAKQGQVGFKIIATAAAVGFAIATILAVLTKVFGLIGR